ncbi:hypothetical protein NSP34_25195, partial [Salmonella enterica]|nr:hypothetical protein [Salmonella enterica]
FADIALSINYFAVIHSAKFYNNYSQSRRFTVDKFRPLKTDNPDGITAPVLHFPALTETLPHCIIVKLTNCLRLRNHDKACLSCKNPAL